MNDTTPQIEAILDELSELCCEALEQEKTLDKGRVGELTESLSTNGWERHSDDLPSLNAVIETRALGRCKDPAKHRGPSISALVGEIQRQYDRVKPDASNAPH